MSDLLTTEAVRRWARCPVCNAAPSKPCVENDKLRNANHKQRARVARNKVNEHRIYLRNNKRKGYNGAKDD